MSPIAVYRAGMAPELYHDGLAAHDLSQVEGVALQVAKLDGRRKVPHSRCLSCEMIQANSC